jgi:hypothetical protein
MLALAETSSVNPAGLLLLGSRLYWANEGTSGNGAIEPNTGSIFSVDVDGGPTTMIAGGENDPLALATDGTFLYWTAHGVQTSCSATGNDGAVRAASLAGGTAYTVASGECGPTNITWGSTTGTLYWTPSNNTTNVRTIGVSNGVPAAPAATDLPAMSFGACGIAFDPATSTLYWTTSSLSGGLAQYGASGLVSTPPKLEGPDGLVVDDADVFWLDYTYTLGSGGGLWRLAKGAPATEAVEVALGNAGKFIAQSASAVYFTAPGAGGTAAIRGVVK